MQGELGDRVRDAYALAAAVHAGQARKSGEPYILHPLAVAELLFDCGADQDVVCAALLHDVLEEGDAPSVADEIHARFGDHVLYLVHAVSKDDRIIDKAEQHHAYLEQIAHALQIDLFVFFIKMADLIHNMSTIAGLSPSQKERWVRELKYDYLPLFSDFYHRIPSHYRETYHHLLDAVQSVIDVDDRASSAAT